MAYTPVSVLAPYAPAAQDVSSDPLYVGFIRPDGAWYIKKVTLGTTPYLTQYASGSSGFSTAWTNRTSLTYVEFDALTW